MNIEARLTEIIGDVGKKLHTGRSRNDQVGLTFRLFVADRLTAWQQRAAHLCATLVSCADGHQDDILPGCTHMQPAQPVSLAHHLLAYAWMFRRDCMRLDDVLKRVRISPLGSAALAGTTYPLDPQSVADAVGFDGIYGNSMDAVSDRDFVLEALFAGSCIMAHLSRLCEELIIWANPAFGFVQLSDGYSTGSSIMPQKKNPDVAELMRGSLMGMLTIMKGLPMTYNRDLQEDKEGFLDADRTVDASLMLMAGMLEELTFRTDRMRAACARGFLNATELADYLVGFAAGVQKRGKCQSGQRTIYDAVLPAAEAAKAAVEADPAASLQTVIAAALAAAKEGVEATKHMTPVFGKAAVHAAQCVGVADQGAVAGCYKIQGLYDYICG